jgi:sulfide dehydrogenase cytochrome subunit
MTTRICVASAILFASACAGFAAEAPPGAAACSGCHTSNARIQTPVPRLVGRNAAETVTMMQEFRSGQRPGTVMDRIAKGFSDDEVRAIAAWYAEQK